MEDAEIGSDSYELSNALVNNNTNKIMFDFNNSFVEP